MVLFIPARGGHIDIAHLRWNADYTRYLVKKTCETLMKNKKGFSFRVTIEPSKHCVEFTYPKGWKNLGEKEKIAEEIAFGVGPYLAYNATLWHEIVTWFGTHFVGFEPEFNSAFSWEDLFSNLLGTRLAVKALRDSEHSYDKAIMLAIYEELEKLDVQSKNTAIRASEKMRGKWFVGRILVDTKKKNFDVGIDGYATPTLVPGIEQCGEIEPLSYPVPNTNVLDRYGFSMKYEIEPRIWEEGKIFRIVDNPGGRIKKINPEKHYPKIMEYIKREAAEKYDYDFDE